MSRRRILTAREQHQMLAPWREAAVDPYAPGPGQDPFSPTPHWFHASPHELPPGTVLTPRGGKTTWNRFYNQLDPQQAEEIQNHVWLDNNINISRSRAHGRGHYIYRVEPHTEPRELGLAGGGHSTDAATIQELIEQTPKRQRKRAAAPKKIYRGIRLTNLPPELHQRIDDLQQLPMHEGEVGQHLQIGPMLLDHLHNTPWKPFTQTPDHLQYTGLGRHWSRRREFAQLAASNQVGPGMSVVLEADDPGEQHYDPDRPMTGGYGPDDPHEQENTLLPGTPLNITSIRLPGKSFEEVLDDPYYHDMEREYGHPYPGGPRPGVGGVTVDPFSRNASRIDAPQVAKDYAEQMRNKWQGQ